VFVFARNLDWRAVGRAVRSADPFLLGAAVVLWTCTTALQGTRWFSLVRALAKPTLPTVLACNYVGQAGSIVLPMRAGEAVRAELLSRSTGLPRAVAYGTVAIDHTVNGAVMFVIAATLPFLLPLPVWTRIVLWCGVGVAAGLVAVMLRLARKPQHRPEAGPIWHFVARLRGGLVGLRRPRSVAGAATAALAAWTCEICTTSVALHAFHLPHGVPQAMAVLFGINLALAIPAPPANLGNFELGAGFALVALGGQTDQAAAFAIGYHALQVLPTLLIGAVSLVKFRGRQLAAAAHVAAHPSELEEAAVAEARATPLEEPERISRASP
jgi:uncharacterized membrane protein YbhN (UPF0104 family)